MTGFQLCWVKRDGGHMWGRAVADLRASTGGGGGLSPGTLPPPGLVHHLCNITFVITFCNS